MVVNKCQSQTKPLVRQQAQPDKCVLYYWACQQQQKSPYHRRRAGAALMTAVFATRQVPALRQAQPDTQEARLWGGKVVSIVCASKHSQINTIPNASYLPPVWIPPDTWFESSWVSWNKNTCTSEMGTKEHVSVGTKQLSNEIRLYWYSECRKNMSRWYTKNARNLQKKNHFLGTVNVFCLSKHFMDSVKHCMKQANNFIWEWQNFKIMLEFLGIVFHNRFFFH